MSQNIGFFTAITYSQENKTFTQSLLEKVDDYFYLGGEKAYVTSHISKDGRFKAILSGAQISTVEKVGKIASYFTVVIPAALLATKAILRAIHSFQLIDPVQKLEKRLNVSEEVTAKIQRLYPAIIRRDIHPEIEWINHPEALIFKFYGTPNLLFTASNDAPETETYFNNIVTAKKVCLAHNLDCLSVPNSKKINIPVGNNIQFKVIAQENLDARPKMPSNEHSHLAYLQRQNDIPSRPQELDKAMRQLATFVAKTGMYHINAFSIPTLKEEGEEDGLVSSKRIGLINLTSMGNTKRGYIGSMYKERGLIGCAASEEQINTICEIAKKERIGLQEEQLDFYKDVRMIELRKNADLLEFYREKGIRTGKEPLHIDIETLGLPLDHQHEYIRYVRVSEEDEEPATVFIDVRAAVQDVIEYINTALQKAPEDVSIKGKRCIFLDIHDESLNLFSRFRSLRLSSFKDRYKDNWIYDIVESLKMNGHIFEIFDANRDGLYIQA